MEITFTVQGEPHGKARPKFNSESKRTYTPKPTVEYEKLVRQSYSTSNGGKRLEGEIEAYITAFYQIPKSAKKSLKEAMERGDVAPTKKPDVDNVAKSILDALNGLAYTDDSQITTLTVRKVYSWNPCVEVALREASGK